MLQESVHCHNCVWFIQNFSPLRQIIFAMRFCPFIFFDSALLIFVLIFEVKHFYLQI